VSSPSNSDNLPFNKSRGYDFSPPFEDTFKKKGAVGSVKQVHEAPSNIQSVHIEDKAESLMQPSRCHGRSEIVVGKHLKGQ
jgi:hypothetical protein